MPIQPINSTNTAKKKYRYNPVKITGYAAVALGTASVIQASRHKIKSHKILAILSIISTIAHIGIIEYFHNKK